MRRWGRGTRVALAVAIACAVVAGLAAIVAAGTGQPGDQASSAASATESSAHAGKARPPIQVKGIVVTQDNPVPTEATAAVPPVTAPPVTAPPVTAPPAARETAVPAPAPEPAATPEPPPCPDPGGGSLVEAIVNGHRSIRCQNGLPDVALDAGMSANAQFHAERLMAAGACANLFHSSELPSWYGSGGAYWGENAACMQWASGCWGDASRIMTGWMASAEHRPNILNPNYHWVGVGIACDGTHTYFVVHFRS